MSFNSGQQYTATVTSVIHQLGVCVGSNRVPLEMQCCVSNKATGVVSTCSAYDLHFHWSQCNPFTFFDILAKTQGAFIIQPLLAFTEEIFKHIQFEMSSKMLY